MRGLTGKELKIRLKKAIDALGCKIDMQYDENPQIREVGLQIAGRLTAYNNVLDALEGRGGIWLTIDGTDLTRKAEEEER